MNARRIPLSLVVGALLVGVLALIALVSLAPRGFRTRSRTRAADASKVFLPTISSVRTAWATTWPRA